MRRFLAMAAVLLLLAPAFTPVTAQTTGAPTISLTSQYMLNGFGFVVLNETLTFSNNGTSAVQIPAVQMGIPNAFALHTPGFVLISNDKYTDTSSNNGNVTTFTITPSSPTLAAGASSTVSLRGYVTGLLDITAGATGNISALTILNPSLDHKVNTLNQDIVVPSGGAISPIPVGFLTVPANTEQIYAGTETNVTPSISTLSVTFSDTSQSAWTPVQLYSVTRTVVAGPNGVPLVLDKVSLRNLASYSITNLRVYPLNSGVTNVTILPSSSVPTINPTSVTLTNGALSIASAPFSGQIQAGDNFTFAMEYPMPKSEISTAGSTVSVSVPYHLTIPGVTDNYTLTIALPDGMHASGQTRFSVANATSLLQGTLPLKYTISPGWGASQALPAAALLFAATFAVLAFSRVQTVSKAGEDEEEEEEVAGERFSDLIKILEEKISLFQQFQDDVSKGGQGTVARGEFNKIKTELDALKVRATSRLNAVRQAADSQRYSDLLGQVQEAEREEDRAAKDLINLYDQYHSRRMREETFRRLQPSYKKRVDSATNHLADLLNLAQREGKQA